MRYYFTDFFYWEQPLINQLRKEGYFVYGERDIGDDQFSIEERVIVNNIGFLVTTKKLDTPLYEEELFALGTEDNSIADEIRRIADSISSELAHAKAQYELAEVKRQKVIDELQASYSKDIA